MPSHLWRTPACLLVVGLLLGAPARACTSAHRAPPLSPRCHTGATLQRLRVARDGRAVVPRWRHSHTGWTPVIPPFDQAEAEAEVHEIAPYRTYPFYPLFPAIAPYGSAW